MHKVETLRLVDNYKRAHSLWREFGSAMTWAYYVEIFELGSPVQIGCVDYIDALAKMPAIIKGRGRARMFSTYDNEYVTPSELRAMRECMTPEEADLCELLGEEYNELFRPKNKNEAIEIEPSELANLGWLRFESMGEENIYFRDSEKGNRYFFKY